MPLFGRKKDKQPANSADPVEVRLDDGACYTPAKVVDCIGDSCPRPQLMTKKALGTTPPGDVIEVRVDNPTSMEAIPPMMPELGARHLGTVKLGHYWSVLVTRD